MTPKKVQKHSSPRVVIAGQLVNDRGHVVADRRKVPNVVLEERVFLDFVDTPVAQPTRPETKCRLISSDFEMNFDSKKLKNPIASPYFFAHMLKGDEIVRLISRQR
jgi:hypothetical protein